MLTPRRLSIVFCCFRVMTITLKSTTAFTTPLQSRPSSLVASSFLGSPSLTPLRMVRYKTMVREEESATTTEQMVDDSHVSLDTMKTAAATALAMSSIAIPAWAEMDFKSISNVGLTPDTFQPVCSASDGFYRTLQQTVSALVGPEKFTEYGPLIAGGLLRVRLELCVVESFFNEAVGPFIRDNGVSWILPLHETVETFLAGGIFAVATTFILIGSTKLLTVIMTYTDFVFGLPARIFGGFAFDRAQGKPVTLDIGFGPFKTRVMGPPEPKEGDPVKAFNFGEASAPEIVVVILTGAVNYFGQTLKLFREILEAIDAFVGRYLVLGASAYLLIKFLHFKIFPDFPF